MWSVLFLGFFGGFFFDKIHLNGFPWFKGPCLDPHKRHHRAVTPP